MRRMQKLEKSSNPYDMTNCEHFIFFFLNNINLKIFTVKIRFFISNFLLKFSVNRPNFNFKSIEDSDESEEYLDESNLDEVNLD